MTTSNNLEHERIIHTNFSSFGNVDEHSDSTSLKAIQQRLVVIPEDKITLQKATKSQADCNLWHKAWRHRIIGSKCGRILLQKQKTICMCSFQVQLAISN